MQHCLPATIILPLAIFATCVVLPTYDNTIIKDATAEPIGDVLASSVTISNVISVGDTLLESNVENSSQVVKERGETPSKSEAPVSIEIVQNPYYLLWQFAISGAVAGAALFVANILLDIWRRPRIEIDTSEIPVVPIDLVIFETDDILIPIHLRRLTIRYWVSRIIVRNRGRNAGENCKGILAINNDELKVCWYLPSERNRITINSHSLEYLDLCAVFDGDRNAEVNSIISQLRDLVNFLDGLDGREQFRLRLIRDLAFRLLTAYRTAEDIPLIIAPVEDGWLYPPAKNRLINSGNARVMISSKNAPLAQRQIVILDAPDADHRIVGFRI